MPFFISKAVPPPSRPQPSAFTLLEVCIAVFIAAMLVMAALPTLSGFLEDQPAEASFNEFHDLVREVRRRSMSERRPYVMIWGENEVIGQRDGARGGDEADVVGRFVMEKGEAVTLTLPAAMKKNPEWIWTFWPNGVCEPATVQYRHDGATWTATYDPFTANATVSYE